MNAVITPTIYQAAFVPRRFNALIEPLPPTEQPPSGTPLTMQDGTPLTLQDGVTPLNTQ